MKRVSAVLAIAVLALVGVFQFNALSNNGDEAAVLAAQDATHRALVNRDVATLYKVLAPSFISNGGEVSFTQQEIINGVATQRLSYSRIDAFDRKVTFSSDGQSATVTGTKSQIGSYNGINLTSTYRFVTTYVNTAQAGWVATSTAVLC